MRRLCHYYSCVTQALCSDNAATGTARQCDIAAANSARPKAGMRLFAAHKVQRCSFLLAASVLQDASDAENSSRTKGKLASPPILLWRVEQGRRMPGGCRHTKMLQQIAACKNHNIKRCKEAKSKASTQNY